MAKRVEQAMKAEHRTRSELIRKALHVYFSARLISNETPTVAEARAHRRGTAAHKRGDYMTLEACLNGMSIVLAAKSQTGTRAVTGLFFVDWSSRNR
jgi:hypothetical protein